MGIIKKKTTLKDLMMNIKEKKGMSLRTELV
jgi:hypothetical protein